MADLIDLYPPGSRVQVRIIHRDNHLEGKTGVVIHPPSSGQPKNLVLVQLDAGGEPRRIHVQQLVLLSGMRCPRCSTVGAILYARHLEGLRGGEDVMCEACMRRMPLKYRYDGRRNNGTKFERLEAL